jgi:hypothetical protein
MRWDVEMEAIWLATANSDLRSEQRELKAKIERLEAENFRLEAENDQCVRTLNQYMEAVQQMVTLLAEKDAEIERLVLARDPWADRLIAAWEEARRERGDTLAEVERLRALVDDYENAITWDTTCTNCAKLLDDNYDQYCEIERLRAAGDLLAEDLGDNPWADRLIAAWEEARRER